MSIDLNQEQSKRSWTSIRARLTLNSALLFSPCTSPVFDNCRQYNPPASSYFKSANRLEKFLRDELPGVSVEFVLPRTSRTSNADSAFNFSSLSPGSGRPLQLYRFVPLPCRSGPSFALRFLESTFLSRLSHRPSLPSLLSPLLFLPPRCFSLLSPNLAIVILQPHDRNSKKSQTETEGKIRAGRISEKKLKGSLLTFPTLPKDSHAHGLKDIKGLIFSA